MNYNNLQKYPIDVQSFIERAKLLFTNISFHKDIENHLARTSNGGLNAFSKEFARALLALHVAMPELSIGDTEGDLLKIRNITSETGNTMECTRQGSNKTDLIVDFEISDINNKKHTISKLNCEFHLKIDFNNAGRRVPSQHYKRAYFGLPVIAKKRYIALLRLGNHY